MKDKKAKQLSFVDRLMMCLASLIFSIPTAILIWLMCNYAGAGIFFFNPSWLWVLITFFAFLGFIAPRQLENVLAWTWRWIVRIWKWE